MKALTRILAVAGFVAVGVAIGWSVSAIASSAHRLWSQERQPVNLDFELVAVDESSVTQLTDLTGVIEVQVTNDFDVDVCVVTDTDTNCTNIAITCPTGSNHTIVKAGASKSWPIPKGWSLCAKSNGAPTGQFYVEERD